MSILLDSTGRRVLRNGARRVGEDNYSCCCQLPAIRFDLTNVAMPATRCIDGGTLVQTFGSDLVNGYVMARLRSTPTGITVDGSNTYSAGPFGGSITGGLLGISSPTVFRTNTIGCTFGAVSCSPTGGSCFPITVQFDFLLSVALDRFWWRQVVTGISFTAFAGPFPVSLPADYLSYAGGSGPIVLSDPMPSGGTVLVRF